MAFEFGMFHEFQRTAGVTDEEAFATSFEEIDAAERRGPMRCGWRKST
jgi:hypothetical protein